MKLTFLGLPVVLVLSACGGSGTQINEEGPTDQGSSQTLTEGAVEVSIANGTASFETENGTITATGGSNFNGVTIANDHIFYAGANFDVGAMRDSSGNEYTGFSGDVVMPTVSAQYNGNVSLKGTSVLRSGSISLDLDLSAADPSITGTGLNGDLTVDASANDDGTINGTVAFAGSSSDMVGAFFGEGASSLAGSFSSDDYLGVITAEK